MKTRQSSATDLRIVAKRTFFAMRVSVQEYPISGKIFSCKKKINWSNIGGEQRRRRLRLCMKKKHVSRFIIYNPLRATLRRWKERRREKSPVPWTEPRLERLRSEKRREIKIEKKTDREERKRVERVARLRRKMLLVMLQAVQPATYTDVLKLVVWRREVKKGFNRAQLTSETEERSGKINCNQFSFLMRFFYRSQSTKFN